MSWLFSRALVEVSSAVISSDGAPSVPSSATPTPQAFLLRDKTTAHWRRFPSGMTCAPLTADRGEAVLMSYLADFPVRTSAPPDKAQASTARARGSGQRWPASLAKYDRASSSWRTPQCSLLAGLDAFSATWPRWGTMRDGECWEHATPVRRISENESGSWPTPNKMDMRAEASMCSPEIWQERQEAKARQGICLHFPLRVAVMMWPSKPAKGQTYPPSQALRNTPPLNVVVGGNMNPTWVEWLMGWPLGWTDLRPLETDRFQQWCASHGAH